MCISSLELYEGYCLVFLHSSEMVLSKQGFQPRRDRPKSAHSARKEQADIDMLMDQLVELQPLINEANQMSEDMGCETSFKLRIRSLSGKTKAEIVVGLLMILQCRILDINVVYWRSRSK